MDLLDIVEGILAVKATAPAFGSAADDETINEEVSVTAKTSLISAIPGTGNAAKITGTTVETPAEDPKASASTEKPISAVFKTKHMAAFLEEVFGKIEDGAKKSGNDIDRNSSIKQKKEECFTGDTLVCTNYGFCPIKKVQKGDDIYSRNEKTGETGLRKVEEVMRNEAHTIYHIWLDDSEEIKTTADHPVFAAGKGWVNAINLREGDMVETMEGAAQISRIMKVQHEEPVEVYNFHVKEWETYFVSGRQVYVHNCKKCAENKRHKKKKRLLPGEGDIGLYNDLKRENKVKNRKNLSAHHMPSAEYWRQYNKNYNDNINTKKVPSMNVEMPRPGKGGRHRHTETYDHNMTNEQKKWYYSLSPRDALAHDIIDLIQIYKSEGLYSKIRPKLLEYIKEFKKFLEEHESESS